MMWLRSFAVVLCVAFVSSDEAPLPWWRTAVFYQVYPRSFMDGDGNGIGDLRGITKMASYFKEIGVDAIWLNPINKSPMVDFGYDISDFTDIASIYGAMEDYDVMVAKLRELGIKLVFDFVPNHTSDKHIWFQASSNPSHPLHVHYKDFYVWRPASGMTASEEPIPPNNWISVFGGSSWQWCENRELFYLHHFVKEQPDLNYRNPDVISNMTAIINFWLDKGVDGLRMDAPKFIYENATFPDQDSNGTYDTMEHNYDENQPETFELLKYWTDLIYQRVQQDGRERAIFTEVYDKLETEMKYYGEKNRSMQIEFNFILLGGNLASRPADIKRLIYTWMNAMPNGSVPNWVMGNHDNSRVTNRYSPEMADAVNMIVAVLPGVMCVYYGEEIGMENTYILWNQTVDPRGILAGPSKYLQESRDPERTPMQWNNSTSAGFSTNATTWLPVNPNYWWLNVEAQRAAPVSHLKVFQAMTKIRKDPVFQRGDLKVHVPDEHTLLIVRSYNGSYFALLINMGSYITTYTSQNLFGLNGIDLDMDTTVVVTSMNSGYSPGYTMKQGFLSITLRPKVAVLLRSGITPQEYSAGSQSLISINLLICTFLIGVLNR